MTAPVLVASGTDDAHTTIGEIRRLFARAPDPKLFWAVPDAAHVDLERFAGGPYWDHVLPFLERSLRRDR